ncbi:MAG TPA: acetolactate synthase small subunit [Bryobacteraceae bacterium]|jgi:acetolactate synthase-1/3 small subunit|nr:acetolactate synthase small subunit [Bryobacteraceae bacterium]
MRQTIQIWLENRPGALMRVAGILTAKGCNIETLTVAPDPWREGISRMTIVADVEERLHGRVVKEMNRLVNVLCAQDAGLQRRGPNRERPAC